MHSVHVLVLVLWVRTDGDELLSSELAQVLTHGLLGFQATLCGQGLNADIRCSGCEVLTLGTFSLTEKYCIDEMMEQGHIHDLEPGCGFLLEELTSFSFCDNVPYSGSPHDYQSATQNDYLKVFATPPYGDTSDYRFVRLLVTKMLIINMLVPI